MPLSYVRVFPNEPEKSNKYTIFMGGSESDEIWLKSQRIRLSVKLEQWVPGPSQRLPRQQLQYLHAGPRGTW